MDFRRAEEKASTKPTGAFVRYARTAKAGGEAAAREKTQQRENTLRPPRLKANRKAKAPSGQPRYPHELDTRTGQMTV